MFLMVGWSLETLREESEEKKQHFFLVEITVFQKPGLIRNWTRIKQKLYPDASKTRFYKEQSKLRHL